jgi:hypothetical protein
MSKDNFILQMWNKSPAGTIAGGVVLFFLAKWGIKKIIKATKLKPPPAKLIPDQRSLPVGWSPTPLATELHNVLEGWPGNAWDKAETYAKLTALTDGQFIAVYNEFNKLYYREGEGTLTDWIRDEYNQPANSDVIEARLLRLNLE